MGGEGAALSLTQQVRRLLKRWLDHLNRKFARIFVILSSHKVAGSLGAVAGFAISIILTWKFTRSPARSRRIRKERDTGSASTSNDAFARQNVDVSSTTGDSENIQQPEALGTVEHSCRASELLLQEMVRKKLNGGRKMTCRLLGVLLEESSPEELQNHATVRTSAVGVLLEISKFCDVSLMERTLDDETGAKVITALENADVFRNGTLLKDKVLFCSTEDGISSFVRQLQPDWHVETNPDVLFHLSRFVRYQLYISPGSTVMASGSNVFISTSVDSYFAVGMETLS